MGKELLNKLPKGIYLALYACVFLYENRYIYNMCMILSKPPWIRWGNKLCSCYLASWPSVQFYPWHYFNIIQLRFRSFLAKYWFGEDWRMHMLIQVSNAPSKHVSHILSICWELFGPLSFYIFHISFLLPVIAN